MLSVNMIDIAVQAMSNSLAYIGTLNYGSYIN